MINMPEMGFSRDPQLGDQKEFAVYGTNFCSAIHCCSFRLFNVNLKSADCCKIVTFLGVSLAIFKLENEVNFK